VARRREEEAAVFKAEQEMARKFEETRQVLLRAEVESIRDHIQRGRKSVSQSALASSTHG
jgi:anti-sigma28 factor (negative regulator of flagellin synthesis)